jgi:hypothetical protein
MSGSYDVIAKAIVKLRRTDSQQYSPIIVEPPTPRKVAWASTIPSSPIKMQSRKSLPERPVTGTPFGSPVDMDEVCIGSPPKKTTTF